MEIRLGIQHSQREIVIETTESSESVSARIAAAVAEGSTLELSDDRGRVVIVPADRLAYAELATEEPRRVGFLG